MATKKGILKINNGTGYDIVNIKTTGEQVILKDGKSVQDLADTVASINVGGGTALVVADITARDALVNVISGQIAYVVDATGDTTVKLGAASYIYDGTNWVKIAEFESLDIIIDWSDIQNKPEIPSIKVSTTEPTGQKTGDIWIEETV